MKAEAELRRLWSNPQRRTKRGPRHRTRRRNAEARVRRGGAVCPRAVIRSCQVRPGISPGTTWTPSSKVPQHASCNRSASRLKTSRRWWPRPLDP